MYPHIITLWNCISENTTGGKTYQRTVLKNVRYEVTTSSKKTDKGSENATSIMLFINPSVMKSENKYLDSELFNNQSNKSKFFTFNNETIFAKGVVNSNSPTGDYYCISQVDPKNDYSGNIHHFEIKGA